MPTEKKDYSKLITNRFFIAIDTIIHDNSNAGGPFTTVKAVAKSIGANQSTFPGIKKGERNLSLELAAKLCQIHKIDANWLLLGQGALHEPAPDKLDQLEQRLMELEKKVGKKG